MLFRKRSRRRLFVFFIPELSRQSRFPPDRDEAVRLELAAWVDCRTCEECGMYPRIMWIRPPELWEPDQCAGCATKRLTADRAARELPLGRPEALAMGSPVFLRSRTRLCRHGPHLDLRYTVSGTCVGCQSERRMRSGRKVYKSRVYCEGCGRRTPMRNTIDDSCVSCAHAPLVGPPRPRPMQGRKKETKPRDTGVRLRRGK